MSLPAAAEHRCRRRYDGADQTLTVVTGVGGCVGTGGRSAISVGPGAVGKGVAAGADEPADNPAGSRGADHDRRNGEAPASVLGPAWEPGRASATGAPAASRGWSVSWPRPTPRTRDTRRSARGAATRAAVRAPTARRRAGARPIPERGRSHAPDHDVRRSSSCPMSDDSERWKLGRSPWEEDASRAAKTGRPSRSLRRSRLLRGLMPPGMRPRPPHGRRGRALRPRARCRSAGRASGTAYRRSPRSPRHTTAVGASSSRSAGSSGYQHAASCPCPTGSSSALAAAAPGPRRPCR